MKTPPGSTPPWGLAGASLPDVADVSLAILARIFAIKSSLPRGRLEMACFGFRSHLTH